MKYSETETFDIFEIRIDLCSGFNIGPVSLQYQADIVCSLGMQCGAP